MKKVLLWIALSLILLAGATAIYLYIFTQNAYKISEGSTVIQTTPPKAALMVIDIQEGITGAVSDLEAYKILADSLINNVNIITAAAACNEIPIVYIRSEVSDVIINLLNSSMKKGSQGVALDKRLNISGHHIFAKQKNDAFSNPELDSFLIKNGINQLYITGLDAAKCVNSTIMAAQNRGYNIVVIDEAVVADDKMIKEQKIKEFKETGIKVISLKEFLNIMAGC